ncbi:MAG: SMC-Scp complex subunit ScpB [Proteocatella sp.]
MTIDKISGTIESILFVASESMNIKDLQKIFLESGDSNVTIKDIKIAIGNLKKKYEAQNCGLSLMKTEETYQLISKIDNNKYVEKILIKTKKKSLSQAALEVLSIVVYRQPVTKIEIDEIRGVKSDSAMTSLVDNGLIYESGRLEKIGKPILYSTTEKFLVEFAIDSLNSMPEMMSIENCPVQINIGDNYGK